MEHTDGSWLPRSCASGRPIRSLTGLNGAASSSCRTAELSDEARTHASLSRHLAYPSPASSWRGRGNERARGGRDRSQNTRCHVTGTSPSALSGHVAQQNSQRKVAPRNTRGSWHQSACRALGRVPCFKVLAVSWHVARASPASRQLATGCLVFGSSFAFGLRERRKRGTGGHAQPAAGSCRPSGGWPPAGAREQGCQPQLHDDGRPRGVPRGRRAAEGQCSCSSGAWERRALREDSARWAARS
mmetsp:Transcript_71301/g.202219  ORF Transcript_71301/g.202219 Transcript_71301/m.202219 type:complete len:244 (-) Transcript_71301:310-1041(-)